MTRQQQQQHVIIEVLFMLVQLVTIVRRVMVYVDRNDAVNFLFSILSDEHEEFMEKLSWHDILFI